MFQWRWKVTDVRVRDVDTKARINSILYGLQS
jgi:hypothetical protein